LGQTGNTSTPNARFGTPASRERLDRVAEALGSHGIHAVVAANAEEAKRLVLRR
jgi:hypothetical protein